MDCIRIYKVRCIKNEEIIKVKEFININSMQKFCKDMAKDCQSFIVTNKVEILVEDYVEQQRIKSFWDHCQGRLLSLYLRNVWK